MICNLLLPAFYSYELCTDSTALFETLRLMRETDKPALANALKTKINPSKRQIESVRLNKLCHLWLYASSVDSLAWVWTNIWRKLQFLCKLWSKFKNATVVFDGYETLKMVDALKTMCITEKVLMYLEQNKWGLQFIKFHEKKTDIFTDVKKQRVVHWQAVPEVKQCRSTQCHTTCNQRCRPFDCTHSSQMFDL